VLSNFTKNRRKISFYKSFLLSYRETFQKVLFWAKFLKNGGKLNKLLHLTKTRWMILIKNATVVDPQSSWNGKVTDLLIDRGRLAKIGKGIKNNNYKTIEGDDLHVSAGWLDIGAQIGEPGLEHREDLQSVSRAAAVGGYTALANFPNTNPTIHSKSEVSYLKNHSNLVTFFPIGALSRDCKGVDLAELYEMAAIGALAFSDGEHAIQSAGLMKRGLEYLKGINGLLINAPSDKSLAKGGQIHEGTISTSLGMKGIPTLSETLMLKRDLELLAYTESRLHVHNISSAESVALIRKAKAQGLAVTASVAAMNLVFNETALQQFDPNFKVLPPLRGEKDSLALIEGLKDGTIDCINSNHTPLEIEAKKLEFSYADFGVIGLESTYALLNTHLNNVFSQEDLVNFLAIQPRKILNLPPTTIQEKSRANITVFQPNKDWIFSKKDIFSKSQNTPHIGASFKGKVLGVINGALSSF
jgi:dihydroorotase